MEYEQNDIDQALIETRRFSLMSSLEQPVSRYLVAQVGARRGYSVAAALEQAGILEALYTDLCADLNPGRALCGLGRVIESETIRRLQGRRVSKSILTKTRSFAWSALRYEWEKRLAGADPEQYARVLSSFGTRLGKDMARAGFGNATHLYTMLGDVTPLLEAARARDITTVTEIYVILTGELIVAQERARYPGFETDLPEDVLNNAFAWLRDVIALSDWLIVPSQAVQDDLVRNFGVSAKRCLLVPYAVSDSWFDVRNQPIHGRILFVGTAGLRKGIHTLGQAAHLLGNNPYRYHVAGGVEDAVRRHPLTGHLTFLGRIPRLDVAREYEAADVFVLPSLAEGSAEVTYEALAAGIPVVTTGEAGSVVRDGVEGFIVPTSDPETLAMRVRQIVENRELRERMSQAARARARQFTWAMYSERLGSVLGGLPKRSDDDVAPKNVSRG